MMPANEYVEVRNGGYYVAGTRIGLDVVVYDFRRGYCLTILGPAISCLCGDWIRILRT